MWHKIVSVTIQVDGIMIFEKSVPKRSTFLFWKLRFFISSNTIGKFIIIMIVQSKKPIRNNPYRYGHATIMVR